MAQIRCVYHGAAPNFPTSDQHPDAERFWFVGGAVLSAAPEEVDETCWVVDSIGAPTADEVAAFLPAAG